MRSSAPGRIRIKPIAVRHPVLSGGRSVLVTPIVWAVAMQRRETLLMLLGFGGQIGRAADGNVVCLAEALGNADIVRVLVVNGSQPPGEQCSSRTPGNAPLLEFAEMCSPAVQPARTAL